MKELKEKSTWLMLGGGVVFALLGSMFIAPALFPSPTVRGGPVNLSQAACVGVCGFLGALIGGLIGKWMERSGK
jgi:hypothetical protein